MRRPPKGHTFQFDVPVQPRSRYYVRVVIARNGPEMRGLVRRMFRTRAPRRMLAMTIGVRGKGPADRGVVALAFYHCDALGVGTIVHEMFHATGRWAARVGIRALPTALGDLATGQRHTYMGRAEPEERMARVLDHLVARMVRALYDNGILVDQGCRRPTSTEDRP